jgi:hypothetical protein
MMGLIKEKEKRVSSFLSERILVGYSLHSWDWCSLVLRFCCVFLLNMISLIHAWWGSETWLVKCTVRSNKKSWWNTYKIGVFLLCKILSFHCHCPKSPCPCITCILYRLEEQLITDLVKKDLDYSITLYTYHTRTNFTGWIL